MSAEIRVFVSRAIRCFVTISCIGRIDGRGYQAGSKVGDGYGEDSVWSNDHGIPVWASLLIGICVIAVVIVSCCCYRKCRSSRNNKWIGLPNL